jgi:hypothetical protein
MNNITHALIALSMMTAALASGCGKPSCTELCDEAEGRGCNTFVIGTGSCAGDCDLAERLSSRAGCDAQMEARLDCEREQADICDPGCGSEQSALESCAATYCLANPMDADCQTLAGL